MFAERPFVGEVQKSAFDHDAFHEEYSTSNFAFCRLFRYSRSLHYAPFLIPGLHPNFSVLKTELFELSFERRFKKAAFDQFVLSAFFQLSLSAR